jgi:hypothetical protein
MSLRETPCLSVSSVGSKNLLTATSNLNQVSKKKFLATEGLGGQELQD